MGGFMDVEEFQINHGLKEVIINTPQANILSAPYTVDSAWGDQATLNTIYENLETVYRCVRFIATNLSKVPIKLFKSSLRVDGEKTEVTDDPAFDLITRRPNPFQTINEFRIETYSRLQLQGECFWHMDRGDNGTGKPSQIFADWDSAQVDIERDGRYMVDKYLLYRNGKTFVVPPEEVFFIKFFNPYDTIRGLSPLRAARHSVQLDLNAIGFNKNFFKQGMKMSGVLSTEQNLEHDQAMRFKESFEQLYAGTDKMHKIAVLWNGMKFDAIQNMGLKEAQFLELRDMNENKIIQTFGLFPEVLGVGKATYENVKYYRRMAWTETLMPLMNQFIEVLNMQFLPLLTNNALIKAEADYTNIEALKEDRSQKVKDYKTGLDSKAITPNEMRKDVFGKEPFDDPELDKPIQLSSPVQPVAEDTNWYKTKGLYRNVKTVEARTQIWHQEIKALSADEKRFEQNIITYFNQQEDRILKAVDKYVVKKVKLHLTSENVLFDLKQEQEILYKKSTPWIFEIYKKMADRIAREVEAGTIDYELPSVRQALGERVLKFSSFVNNTTDEKIKAIVKNIFDENIGSELSVLRDRLTEEIKLLYDGFTETRADMIARTEVMGSRNMGLQEGMQQAKIQNKMWITSRDSRVRDHHQIDGQVVGVNESFTLQNGSHMLYPMDINERCIIIATNEPKTNF